GDPHRKPVLARRAAHKAPWDPSTQPVPPPHLPRHTLSGHGEEKKDQGVPLLIDVDRGPEDVGGGGSFRCGSMVDPRAKSDPAQAAATASLDTTQRSSHTEQAALTPSEPPGGLPPPSHTVVLEDEGEQSLRQVLPKLRRREHPLHPLIQAYLVAWLSSLGIDILQRCRHLQLHARRSGRGASGTKAIAQLQPYIKRLFADGVMLAEVVAACEARCADPIALQKADPSAWKPRLVAGSASPTQHFAVPQEGARRSSPSAKGEPGTNADAVLWWHGLEDVAHGAEVHSVSLTLPDIDTSRPRTSKAASRNLSICLAVLRQRIGTLDECRRHLWSGPLIRTGELGTVWELLLDIHDGYAAVSSAGLDDSIATTASHALELSGATDLLGRGERALSAGGCVFSLLRAEAAERAMNRRPAETHTAASQAAPPLPESTSASQLSVSAARKPPSSRAGRLPRSIPEPLVQDPMSACPAFVQQLCVELDGDYQAAGKEWVSRLSTLAGTPVRLSSEKSQPGILDSPISNGQASLDLLHAVMRASPKLLRAMERPEGFPDPLTLAQARAYHVHALRRLRLWASKGKKAGKQVPGRGAKTWPVWSGHSLDAGLWAPAAAEALLMGHVEVFWCLAYHLSQAFPLPERGATLKPAATSPRKATQITVQAQQAHAKKEEDSVVLQWLRMQGVLGSSVEGRADSLDTLLPSLADGIALAALVNSVSGSLGTGHLRGVQRRPAPVKQLHSPALSPRQRRENMLKVFGAVRQLTRRSAGLSPADAAAAAQGKKEPLSVVLHVLYASAHSSCVPRSLQQRASSASGAQGAPPHTYTREMEAVPSAARPGVTFRLDAEQDAAGDLTSSLSAEGGMVLHGSPQQVPHESPSKPASHLPGRRQRLARQKGQRRQQECLQRLAAPAVLEPPPRQVVSDSTAASLQAWLSRLGVNLEQPWALQSEHAPEFSDGLVLARVVEACEHANLRSGIPGLEIAPRSGAAKLANIRRALEVLQTNRDMPLQFLWSEEDIRAGHAAVIVPLLLQMKKAYRHVGRRADKPAA
ncbi:unnamed protein product, partial [Symbiodinium sp. KB8]